MHPYSDLKEFKYMYIAVFPFVHLTVNGIDYRSLGEGESPDKPFQSFHNAIIEVLIFPFNFLIVHFFYSRLKLYSLSVIGEFTISLLHFKFWGETLYPQIHGIRKPCPSFYDTEI